MAIRDRRASGENTVRGHLCSPSRNFVISRESLDARRLSIVVHARRLSIVVPFIAQEEGNTSRQIRAGRKEVLTYEEKRERLRGTRLGEILGLDDLSPA